MNYHELDQINAQLKVITQRLDEILKESGQEPIELYPQKGTWRDKILYVLKHIESPLTAKEIAAWIFRIEKLERDSRAENSITQMCSNMARLSPRELHADGNYNIKYSISKKD